MEYLLKHSFDVKAYIPERDSETVNKILRK